MNDLIIEMPASETNWDELLNPFPRQSVLIAEYNDGVDKKAYLTTHTDWPASMVIIGAWDRETGLQEGQTYDVDGEIVLGTPTYALHANYLSFIRPIGNEDGRATGHLDSHRWQGMREQKFLEDSERYPATNRPFLLRITRTKILDDGFPEIPWGWTVQMISDDALRDITARGIGIYSDRDATAYLYTTGAFIFNATSGFYETVCPVGQRKATPDSVYFALLLGAAQEGIFSLDDLNEGTTVDANFWTADQ